MPTRPLVTSYHADMSLFPDLWNRIGLVLALAAIVLFPYLANDHWLNIGINALVAVVGAVGMMVLTGFTGQVSLGHAAFLAVGGYTTAILGLSFGIPFWLCLPLSGLLAALVGLSVGPFALRLEGLYLAIVTIGLMFLVEHMLRNGLEVAYGKDYLSVPMHLWFESGDVDPLGGFRKTWEVGGFQLNSDRKIYFLFISLAVISVWVGKNLQRSNSGRAMMAIRDGELAAGALGVHSARSKMISFGISSFIAGIAGSMYAFAHPVLTLEPFNLKMSVDFVAMVVFGGVGTMFGAVAGALVFTFLHPFCETVGSLMPFPDSFSSEYQSALIFFPVLCLFLLFEPLGLLGIWFRIKRYFLAWPFRY